MKRDTPAGRSPRKRSWLEPVTAGEWPLAGLIVLAVAIFGTGRVLAENPCAPCHGDQVQMAARGPHRGAVEKGAVFCESCHGSSTKHLQSGAAADIKGKAALAKTPLKSQSQWCLTCHRSKFPAWEGAPHARSSELTCTTCHANAWHDPKAKASSARGAAACASCHHEAAATFRRVYHHPVPEEKIACSSCHDTHGRSAAGTREADAKCLDCHQEVAGPYVYPHRALEEGCTGCHTPHGSVNRGLLKTAGNGLCLSCHVQSNFPAVGNVPHNRLLQGGGKCLDCHSEVHGSNVDELLAPRWRRK